MGCCYEIKTCWSCSVLCSYYSKLEVSAFIGIGAGPTDLNHYFQGYVKTNSIFWKKQVIKRSPSVTFGLVRQIIVLYNKCDPA